MNQYFSVVHFINTISKFYPEITVKTVRNILRSQFTETAFITDSHVTNALIHNLDLSVILDMLDYYHTNNTQRSFINDIAQIRDSYSAPMDYSQRNIDYHYNQIQNLREQIRFLEKTIAYHEQHITEKTKTRRTKISLDKLGFYMWLCDNVHKVESIQSKGLMYTDVSNFNLINVFRLLNEDNVQCNFIQHTSTSKLSKEENLKSDYCVVIEDNKEPVLIFTLKECLRYEDIQQASLEKITLFSSNNELSKNELTHCLSVTPDKIKYIEEKTYNNYDKIATIKAIISGDKFSIVRVAYKTYKPEKVFTVSVLKVKATGPLAKNPYQEVYTVTIEE